MILIPIRQTFKLRQYFKLWTQYRRISSENKLTASYCYEQGNFPFLNITLGDLVDRAADTYGDETAFVFPFQNIQKSYTQFKNDANELAAGFINLGLQKGDRLAIWGPNSYEWMIAQSAAAKAGLVSVHINPAYREAELEYSLKKVQCKAIVSAESFKTQNYYEILCNVVPEIPNSKPGQLQSQKLENLQNIISISEKSFPGSFTLKEIIQRTGSEKQNLLNERRKLTQSDDPAIIMFTSGTTGEPKAAVLSHFQMINQAISTVRRLKFHQTNPVSCLQVPLFHAFGTMAGPLLTLLARSKCVIPAEFFHAPSSLKAIEQEKCTLVYGTPTMFNDMLLHLSTSKYDISSWKKVVVGASPVPDELTKQLEQFGMIVTNGYGLTESCAGLSIGEESTPRGSSGRPVEYTEIKIVDGEGKIVPINTKGEILCRNPYVFLGYWDDKQKTDETIDSARWLHTGDLGTMDEDGCIYISGRIKDLVIRGGENIYPVEIENFLLSHPSVLDAYVVGVPDTRMGEELCACVKLKSGEKIGEEDIKNFCKGKISYFKIPRYVMFYDTFPTTESGKIKKYKLKEECTKLLQV